MALASAYTRSRLTGWTIGAGVAEQLLIAPLWRNIAITSLIGGVLLLTGLDLRVADGGHHRASGEMLHDLLIEELNHRVKNTLALDAGDRGADVPQRQPDRAGKVRGPASARSPRRTICSAGRNGQGSELKDGDRPRATAVPAATIPTASA